MKEKQGNSITWAKRDWRLISVLFLFALILRLSNLSSPLETDGADYVMAAQQGFLSNYLDRGSRSTLDFIGEGLRATLLNIDVNIYRDDYLNKDVEALRHYHAPLVIYFIRFFMVLFGSSEVVLRLTPLLFGCLLPAILYWGCTRVIQDNPQFVGFTAGFLAAVTPLLAETSKYVSWHAVFMVWAVLCLFFFVMALQKKNTTYFYIAFFFFALALLTLEYAVLILITLLFGLIFIENPWLVIKKEKIVLSTHLFGMLFLVISVLILLWPASLLKLSLLKNYVFYSQPIVSLLKIAKAAVTAQADTVIPMKYRVDAWYIVYLLFFKRHIFLSLLLFGSLTYTFWLIITRKLNKFYYPFLIFPALIFIINTKVSFVKLFYISHIFPFLYIFCGISLAALLQLKGKNIKKVPVIILALALVFNFNGLLRARTGKDYFRQVTNYLKDSATTGDTIVVAPEDETPTFIYYMPKFNVRFYSEGKDDLKELFSLIKSGRVDFFVVRGTEDFFNKMHISTIIRQEFVLARIFTEKNDKRQIRVYRFQENIDAKANE